MQFTQKKSVRFLIMVLSIIAGNALLAFCIAAFVLPHDIIMGGTTGVGIILSKLFPQLDVSLFILILNVILLIFGLIALGKTLFFTTVASSFLYPAFLAIFERIPGIDKMTDDPLLAAIFTGILLGLSLGLVMRVGSSTGGKDILDLALAKWTHIPVSVYVYVGDFIIVGGQAIGQPIEKLLLAILALMLEALFLSRTLLMGKSQIQVMVFSQKTEEIRDAVLNKALAGATMFHVETGRLRKQELALLTVIPERKLYQTTELIRGIDPNAFITVSKINEAHGRGFTKERQELAEVPIHPNEAAEKAAETIEWE